MATNSLETPKSAALPTILTAGLIAGVLDLTAAVIHSGFRGRTPIFLFQSVASGWFGKAAFEGGWRTAAIGIATHFLIAMIWTTIFYLASRKLTWLVEKPFVSGPLYGIAVYLVMYWIVIPSSAIGPIPHPLLSNLIAVMIHILCIGLPIAWLVQRGGTR